MDHVIAEVALLSASLLMMVLEMTLDKIQPQWVSGSYHGCFFIALGYCIYHVQSTASPTRACIQIRTSIVSSAFAVQEASRGSSTWRIVEPRERQQHCDSPKLFPDECIAARTRTKLLVYEVQKLPLFSHVCFLVTFLLSRGANRAMHRALSNLPFCLSPSRSTIVEFS